MREWKMWTQDQDDWLAEHYAKCTKEEAEEAIGRRWEEITKHCSRRGIARRFAENTSSLYKILPSYVKSWELTEKSVFLRCMSMQEQELDMLLKIYPDEIRMYTKKGKLYLITDKVIDFLKKHQELWDSTKVDHLFFDTDEKWWKKKHDEDFQKMIKARWGEDAK